MRENILARVVPVPEKNNGVNRIQRLRDKVVVEGDVIQSKEQNFAF